MFVLDVLLLTALFVSLYYGLLWVPEMVRTLKYGPPLAPFSPRVLDLIFETDCTGRRVLCDETGVHLMYVS